MSNYIVDGAELTSVANAIRTKGGTSAQLSFPSDFVSAIGAIPTGGEAPVQHGYWTRPAGWPNYESLHMEDSPNDYSVYLTYDTRPNKNGMTQVGLGLAGIPSGAVIEVGTVENGVFVPLETLSVSANTGYTLEEYTPDYVAVRVNLNNSNSGRLEFMAGSAIFWDNALEIFGRPKSGMMFGYNVSYVAGIGYFVQSVKLLDYTAPSAFDISSLNGFAAELMYINTEDFTVSPGNARSYSFFAYNTRFLSKLIMPSCPAGNSLNTFARGSTFMLEIDASEIDTSASTNFNNAFYDDSLLEKLDISGWVISSGATTTNMFYGCNRLHTLICDGTEISAALDVSATMLDHDSLVDLIGALQTVTNSPTLKLGTTLQAKLSAAEIAVATAKGWTIT